MPTLKGPEKTDMHDIGTFRCTHKKTFGGSKDWKGVQSVLCTACRPEKFSFGLQKNGILKSAVNICRKIVYSGLYSREVSCVTAFFKRY
jgi:hypothetical protein